MKKVFYKLDEKRTIMLEVETKEQENLVLELNRNIDSFNKSQINYHNRSFSVDAVFVNEESKQTYEIMSDEANPFEKCISNYQNGILYDAINKLTSKQKNILLKHVVDGLSFRDIATILDNDAKTIYESYKSAIKKLLKLLNKNDFYN